MRTAIFIGALIIANAISPLETLPAEKLIVCGVFATIFTWADIYNFLK